MSNWCQIWLIYSVYQVLPVGITWRAYFFYHTNLCLLVFFFCRVCFWRLPFCLDIFPLEMICVIKIFGHPICLTFLAVGPWKLKKNWKNAKIGHFSNLQNGVWCSFSKNFQRQLDIVSPELTASERFVILYLWRHPEEVKFHRKLSCFFFFSKRTEKNPDFLRPSQRYKLDVIVFIVIYGMYHIKF